jgi:hypothetical protein
MGRGDLMPYLVFIVAVFLSAISAYYSVMGMVAIFAASPVAVALMASGLEAAKLVTASWLYRNWKTAPFFLKAYLSIATAILMLITSMGCFGFLSKAHSDQNLVGGDVISKVQGYDEQIKTSKENIEANRKAIRQMDDAIDQVLSRSDDSRGAEMAVSIRRTQMKERQRLLSEIDAEQKEISRINLLASPIRAEVRKVEAEIGPIKYIAKLIYGDNPDANILEKAVTWVILLLISVFDPLAVLLLIAASISFAKHSAIVLEESESTMSKLKNKFNEMQDKIKEKVTPPKIVMVEPISPAPIEEPHIDGLSPTFPSMEVPKMVVENIPETISVSSEEPITKKITMEDFQNDPDLQYFSNRAKTVARELDKEALTSDEVTWPKLDIDPIIEEQEPLLIVPKSDIIKEYVTGEEVTKIAPKQKRKYKKKSKLEVEVSEPVVSIEKEESPEDEQSSTALNKTKKVVADDESTKATLIPDDLEEVYNDIVTELSNKKSKKGGWFPETTKLKNE